MATIKYPNNFFLGAGITNPRVYYSKIKELIDATNNFIDGDNLTIPGNLVVTGTSTFNGTIVLGDAAADSLTINATTTYGDPINYSNATGITAFATGGQASATALTEEINNVTTCATAGDSVKLKAAVAGAHQYVKNSGAAALDIFPASSDSIDALAINLAIRIQPGSSMHFYSKDAIVWESSIDNSITLNSPTTATGQLEIKAAASAGNTVTTITNASQAAARTYTVPDAGASASFVMTEGAQTLAGVKTFSSAPVLSTATLTANGDTITIQDLGSANIVQSEGAQTINGIKTFGSGIVLPVGAVGTPSVQVGAVDTGLYLVSATQTGFSQDGALVAGFNTNGLFADSLRNRVALGTTPVGTVTIAEFGDGRDITTVLTLTDFVVGALAGAAAALGVGNIVYAFPAGAHLELVNYASLRLTCAGTPVATDTGLGSVIATGAVSVLSGTATFEDRFTGQSITTAADASGAVVANILAVTAGIGTGIGLNAAASVKNVYLNSAGTWNADNTGNLTANGTITFKWTKMSA